MRLPKIAGASVTANASVSTVPAAPAASAAKEAARKWLGLGVLLATRKEPTPCY